MLPLIIFRSCTLTIIKILQYKKIDVSEGIDGNKTSASKKMWALSLLVF